MQPRIDPSGATVLAQQPPSQLSPPQQSYGGGDGGGDVPAGIPAGRPPWLIAVVVGVAALVVGGGIAIVALAR
jgi:hypothetical protein